MPQWISFASGVPRQGIEREILLKISGEEHAELTNLYAFYNLSSDIGTPEEYADCFAPDGILKFNGEVFKQGRKALLDFKREDQASRRSRYRRHWTGSIHLRKIDADTIRGRCYLHAFEGHSGGEPVLADSAVYDDLIVLINGDWKFAMRELAFDFRRNK